MVTAQMAVEQMAAAQIAAAQMASTCWRRMIVGLKAEVAKELDPHGCRRGKAPSQNDGVRSRGRQSVHSGKRHRLGPSLYGLYSKPKPTSTLWTHPGQNPGTRFLSQRQRAGNMYTCTHFSIAHDGCSVLSSVFTAGESWYAEPVSPLRVRLSRVRRTARRSQW